MTLAAFSPATAHEPYELHLPSGGYPQRALYSPASSVSAFAPSASLGSASALGQPRWVGVPAPLPASMAMPVSAPMDTPMRAPVSRVLRVPRALLDLMAESAAVVGISEQEIWIEAARLWLREHSASDEPPPTAPAALANPRRARTWASIDAVLAELRQEVAATPDTSVACGNGRDGSAA